MLLVRVEGDREVAAAFKAMGLKTRDLSAAWDRIGAAVKHDAVPLTPTLSGALVKSVRQGKTKSSATVRAGSKKVPYAGVQNYGGYHNIAAKHFLNIALEQNADTAEREVRSEVERIARNVGLT